MEKIVIPFPGSIAERLANAARNIALETKDEEALEAALFLEPSELVLVKTVPADDERLRDFLVRPGILRMAAKDSDVRQVVVYIADGAPQDFWFEAYALAAGRTVRNLVSREEWEPILRETNQGDLKTATAIAQFEALHFVLHQLYDLGRPKRSTVELFRRHQRPLHARLGDGARALRFLDWCVEIDALPAPHPDYRVQAATFLRFSLTGGGAGIRTLDEIMEVLAS